jgi:hypothetical protein
VVLLPVYAFRYRLNLALRITVTCIINSVRFEVFTAVTMKNAVFWDVAPCGSCKIRRSGGT